MLFIKTSWTGLADFSALSRDLDTVAVSGFRDGVARLKTAWLGLAGTVPDAARSSYTAARVALGSQFATWRAGETPRSAVGAGPDSPWRRLVGESGFDTERQRRGMPAGTLGADTDAMHGVHRNNGTPRGVHIELVPPASAAE